ncbi:BamA/TamA family outer membrane protein [Spirosoma sp.]|uniref:BamA/TamA family outer membrane protein n=1 Tax=Spirosoma sp. TaxID=1899569 RepID=UPI003B3AF134
MFPKTWPAVLLIVAVFLSVSQTVFASITVDSTQKVVVRSVTLKGNDRTRDRIILREMSLHVGDSVQLADVPERVAWDQRNINNTTLFITVDTETRITPADDSTQLAQLDLTVIMKERWYLIAYPVFDLADRNFNEWWYDRGRDFSRVIYGGRLSYRNITGNNDRLGVAVELGFLQRTVLSYSIPYIDKAQKIGLRVDLAYQTNKEIPYRTQFDKWVFAKSEDILRTRAYVAAILTHRRGLYHYHTLDVRYTRNTIADTIARLNPDYFLESRTRQQFASMSYNYRYDRRDNVVYPLRGTLLSGGVSVSGLLPSDDFHFLDLAASATRYWPLGGRFYGAGNLRARVTWPTNQPYFSLRGLGSSSDMVRGYELYVIDGQRTAIWRNSLRYQLVDTRKQLKWLHIRQFNTVPISIYLTGFADAGYVSSTVAEQYQSQLANRLLLGTGMSLDLVTFYNLVMRFSGTINAQGKTGFFFNLAQEL